MKIIFARIPTQFIDLTFTKSLENVCKKCDVEFQLIDLWDNTFDEVPATNDDVVVFCIHTWQRPDSEFEKLKLKLPNSTVVVIESDMIYQDWKSKDYTLVDYLITTSHEIDREYTKGKCFIDWNISQYLIEYAINNRYKIKKDKHYDLICLCNVNNSQTDRVRFFKQIKSKYKLISNLKENNLHKIFEYYAQSKFVLGTSTSTLGVQKRSTKVMRDWLGPFVGTPLIYDNFPEFMVPHGSVVPIYEYLNVIELDMIMCHYWNNFKKYNELIEAQCNHIMQFTLDKQLFLFLRNIKKI